MRPVPTAERRFEGPGLAEVTNTIVRLHTAHYGKGPTRARSYWAGDTLVCQMEETLTPVERTLVARGKGAAVHALRRSFQDAMETEFIGAVERITARSVRAYLSQVHLAPEVDIEVFVMEPLPASDPEHLPKSDRAEQA
jgi:uncharacterized protein YbcI